jgi:hypothetical protein
MAAWRHLPLGLTPSPPRPLIDSFPALCRGFARIA